MSIGCSPQLAVSKGEKNWIELNIFWVKILFSYDHDPSSFNIYAGDVDQYGTGQVYNVAFFVIHESYDEFSNHVNNIALVRVLLLFDNNFFKFS
jgi:hypothetical protein